MTDEQFLTGVKKGATTSIAGVLRVPRPGTDRLPAVILVHGSPGGGLREARWSDQLASIGVATFILDGFTGRGIVSVVDDQTQLGMLTMINDSYRALELLSRHPRIDPNRIAIMGFSRGGRVALYSALERFKRAYGPPTLQFDAYLSFYGGCWATLIDDDHVGDRPIRLFHGTADDWVPIDSCRSYAARLRAAGKDVTMTEYVGAHHTFDVPRDAALERVPRAQNPTRCTVEEKPGGLLINTSTGKPFNWDDACVVRGATVRFDEQATNQAFAAVKDFLTARWSLK